MLGGLARVSVRRGRILVGLVASPCRFCEELCGGRTYISDVYQCLYQYVYYHWRIQPVGLGGVKSPDLTNLTYP